MRRKEYEAPIKNSKLIIPPQESQSEGQRLLGANFNYGLIGCVSYRGGLDFTAMRDLYVY